MPQTVPTALLVLLLVGGCAPIATSPLPQPQSRDAVLRPGDILEIAIWREEDLSGEFLVDEAGVVTLPLLGQIPVSGIALAAVRDTLLVAYSKQLRNPSVSITPLRSVYVLGEVNEPGLHGVDPSMSLAGAIALAGGPSPEGDLRRVRVARDNEIILNGVPLEAALNTIDIRSGDQILVDRRGWFDRNSTFLVSSMISVTSIAISLLR